MGLTVMQQSRYYPLVSLIRQQNRLSTDSLHPLTCGDWMVIVVGRCPLEDANKRAIGRFNNIRCSTRQNIYFVRFKSIRSRVLLMLYLIVLTHGVEAV